MARSGLRAAAWSGFVPGPGAAARLGPYVRKDDMQEHTVASDRALFPPCWRMLSLFFFFGKDLLENAFSGNRGCAFAMPAQCAGWRCLLVINLVLQNLIMVEMASLIKHVLELWQVSTGNFIDIVTSEISLTRGN